MLKEWDTPFADMQSPFRHRAPISFYLRRPRGLLADLARRWPNPIVATISVNGTFGSRRRTRYEIANWLLRAARVVAVRSSIQEFVGRKSVTALSHTRRSIYY